MLNMDKVGEIVQKEVGESPQNVSPASWQTPEGGVIQGFAALTSTSFCFVYESMAGNVEIESFPRSNLSVSKTEMGVSGKTFVFICENEPYKFGGMISNFERIIEKEFVKAPSQPQTAIPPPTAPAPRAQAGAIGGRQSPADMRTFRPPEGQMPYRPGASSSRGPMVAGLIAIVVIAVLAFIGYSFVSNLKSKISESLQNPPPGTAVSTTTTTPSSSDITMTDARGNTVIQITKKETGRYYITAGGEKLKAKVESDRVKIETNTNQDLIKVKVKDYGFKVDTPPETTMIKGKYSGAGYKVKTETTDLGKIDPRGEGYAVTDATGALICNVIAEGGAVQVKDTSGNVLYTIHGAFPKAAAFMPFLKDHFDAQAGVLIFFNEFPGGGPK